MFTAFHIRQTDIYYQTVFATIKSDTNKLRTYSLLKDTRGMAEYIKDISCTKERIELSKLRLSSHKLCIETGRYEDTLRTERFCPFCRIKVEDEIHFTISCPIYKTLR